MSKCPAELTEAQARVQELVDRLVDPEYIPGEEADEPTRATWLLAQLLGWHRREDKSTWWEFHRLMDLEPEELVDESDPIGLLEPIEPIDEVKKGKQTWRYSFPDQDFDIGRRRRLRPRNKKQRPNDKPTSWGVGDVVIVDVAALTVDLRRSVDEPHPRAIVPLGIYVGRATHQESLFELGEWVAANGIDADGPHRAARDLLLGRHPQRRARRRARPLRRADETELAAARRLALVLDEHDAGDPGSAGRRQDVRRGAG